MKPKKIIALLLCIAVFLAMFAACGQSEDPNAPKITISGDGIEGELVYTQSKMEKIADGMFESEYSAINNYPTKKLLAAKGIKISALLEDAGVLDTAKVLTFESTDGYTATVTVEELLNTERYYFPNIMDGDVSGAKRVESIIAFESADSADLSSLKESTFDLIFGQELITEHTTPAFIENISKITVSSEEPTQWAAPTVFPTAGLIDAGETVKLQHDYFGSVKIHYTLDGTDPTAESAMYNPSTYQPELNAPISIEGDTVIKAIVIGYGKKDSEIATFEFKVR